MNTRFYNIRLLTMDGTMDVVPGEVWVEGNRISYAGPSAFMGDANTDAITPPVWDREIDGNGNLLMPGFKNAHTHSAMTFLRSYADDLPLMDWLHTQVFPMEAKLQPGDAFWLSRLAVMEYLTSGMTAAFDMYPWPEEMARACVESGFRTVLVSGLNDFVSSPEGLEEDYLKFNSYDPLVSYQLGFHAEYTTSRKILEAVADLAHKYKAPVFTHNSETKGETEGCLERYGMTPTAFLDSLGMFEYGRGGYHCVHITDEDMDIFKKHDMTIVTNPGSNVKLASGIPRLNRMLEKGVRLAIGTDGPASNNCLDMFREMFLVTGLTKLRENDASAMPAEEVLKMACVGGAYAMGLTDCDCIRKGKLADLVLIDLHQPNMQPVNNIVKNLVYSGSKQNVKLVMIDGTVRYEDGTFFIGEDPEEVYRRANAIIERMRQEA